MGCERVQLLGFSCFILWQVNDGEACEGVESDAALMHSVPTLTPWLYSPTSIVVLTTNLPWRLVEWRYAGSNSGLMSSATKPPEGETSLISGMV